MRKCIVIIAAVCVGAEALASPQFVEHREGDGVALALSVGRVGLREASHVGSEGRLELGLPRTFWRIKPFAGFIAESRGAVHGFAGLLMDLNLGRHWVLTPSLAAGLRASVNGTGLGFPIEFRSQLALTFKFDGRNRIGLSINQVSNARLGDHNTEIDTLVASFVMPFGSGADFGTVIRR